MKIGDKVSKGQTLCILEAMKIMNEIESDISGEIVEVCVENESLVEYGQTLFKVRAYREKVFQSPYRQSRRDRYKSFKKLP